MHAADMVGFNKFLPYMPDVDQCARSLVELNTTWRMLESLARLQGNAGTAMILPTLAAARSGFNALEQDLVKSLVAEKLATAMAVSAGLGLARLRSRPSPSVARVRHR